MATLISDVIDTVVYQDLPQVNSPELTAFYESGIITQNELLNQIANAAGKTAELPFWKDLDETVAPNLSSDTGTATPGKIEQGEQIARKLFLNNGWSAFDLASEIAMGATAMEAVKARVETYWVRQWQRYLVAAANGVLADNVANDSSDMVNNVALEDGDAATAANLFSRSNFTGAAFTLGDAFENTGIIAVHSVVYKRMVDNDDIDFIPDSEGRMTIPTYMGKRVIVDDGMPVVAGSTSGFKYTTALYGAGAFGYGEGMPEMPVEVDRQPAEGNGGGLEVFWSRKTYMLHPFGFQFTSASVAGNSATMAEMALAANWDRVVARKNVPLAFLITNG